MCARACVYVNDFIIRKYITLLFIVISHQSYLAPEILTWSLTVTIKSFCYRSETSFFHHPLCLSSYAVNIVGYELICDIKINVAICWYRLFHGGAASTVRKLEASTWMSRMRAESSGSSLVYGASVNCTCFIIATFRGAFPHWVLKTTKGTILLLSATVTLSYTTSMTTRHNNR